jgi:hypothetical protein
MPVTIIKGGTSDSAPQRISRLERQVRELMAEIRSHQARKERQITRPDVADQQLHRRARRILR